MPKTWPTLPASATLELGLIAKFQQATIAEFNSRRHSPNGHGYLQCGSVVDGLCSVLSQKLTLYGLELRQSARSAAAAAAPVPAAPIILPACKFSKLSMVARRKDRDKSKDAADASSGRHWALMIKLGGYYTVVDLTHLQYDIPSKISHGTPGSIMTLNRADAAHYSRAIFADEPFVFSATNKLEAQQAWLQFIHAKPFVDHVAFEHQYPESHDAKYM